MNVNLASLGLNIFACNKSNHFFVFVYRLAKPPHFDLDTGLDDSYDESESTRDTVRRNPHRPSSKTGGSRGLYGIDERDRGGNSRQGSNSQNSGRAYVICKKWL